jgi:hypothetical protein
MVLTKRFVHADLPLQNGSSKYRKDQPVSVAGFKTCISREAG